MNLRNTGWTLIELLLSTIIATMLMVLMVQALGSTQKAWFTTRRAAGNSATVDDALTSMSRALGTVTLAPRTVFDTAGTMLVRDSDLHFVCGPSAELLPRLPGVCGDAIFFQRANTSGNLEASGFFVQYTDDKAHAPGSLPASATSSRFRLMQFHQPAKELELFKSTTTDGKPHLATLTNRSEIYAWFTSPLSDAASPDHVSMVAENVIAMFIQASPGDLRSHDTRRYQWEGDTEDARNSRHILPSSLAITLVITDDESWDRLERSQADSIAEECRQFTESHFRDAGTQQKDLDQLLDFLTKRQIGTKTASLTLTLPEQR